MQQLKPFYLTVILSITHLTDYHSILSQIIRISHFDPDCGLKTRAWKETEESLTRMVQAARQMREELR